MNRLSDLSWPEINDYLAKDNRVILPLGAVEEHGPHLGVGTDFYEAEAIAEAACEATGIVLAPTMNYGMSQSQMGFPGTMSLRPATLQAVIEDLLRALYRHGFRRVLVVNGHGGNTASISSCIETIAHEFPDLSVKYFAWWTDVETSRLIVERMGPQQGSHAADGETAFMMAIRPQAVKMDRLTGRDAPVKSTRDVTNVNTFSEKYPDGIMGLHPGHATREAGEALFKKSVEICSRELNEW